jgi:phospholipid/cholesterol/gamma-HCH transport system ATP-binding protein
MNERERDDRVAWALDLVGLPGVEDMDPADLSGGMRKRVALARSIAVQPEVVLYDEPTTGLDPINTARVNNLITGLQDRLEITSIVVTHDMKSAFSISDRIAMVHSGQIIYQGSIDGFRASRDPRISDFIEGRAPVDEDVETLLNA